MGKEEKGNKYWRGDGERRCRICLSSEETLEHLARDCTPVLNNNKSSFSILHDTRPDIEWMKKLIKIRHSN